MIEPHSLPTSWCERRLLRQFRCCRSLAGFRQTVAVTDLEVPSIRVFHMEAFESFAIVVGYGRQTALPQFRLDCLFVPLIDDEGKVAHNGPARSSRAAASTAASTLTGAITTRRGRGR